MSHPPWSVRHSGLNCHPNFRLCTQEAEITLLELCDRHAEPLPLKYAQWPTTLRRLTTSAQPGTPGHHTLGSGGPNVQETDDGMDLDHG